MTNLYPDGFYSERNKDTEYAARIITDLIPMKKIRSAIDIGCGVGTFLNVLKLNGTRVVGIDGPWVDKNKLVIDKDEFITGIIPGIFNPAEIEHLKSVNFEQFDVALCLEVGEHIPEASAVHLVNYLTLFSDRILFSAAIPYQGGVGHVNEQWPDYWARLFHEKGYTCSDNIRPQIWEDTRIPVWYRQNILWFEKLTIGSYNLPKRLVHPDLYISKARPRFIGEAWVEFKAALKRKVKL